MLAKLNFRQEKIQEVPFYIKTTNTTKTVGKMLYKIIFYLTVCWAVGTFNKRLSLNQIYHGGIPSFFCNKPEQKIHYPLNWININKKTIKETSKNNYNYLPRRLFSGQIILLKSSQLKPVRNMLQLLMFVQTRLR